MFLVCVRRLSEHLHKGKTVWPSRLHPLLTEVATPPHNSQDPANVHCNWACDIAYMYLQPTVTARGCTISQSNEEVSHGSSSHPRLQRSARKSAFC